MSAQNKKRVHRELLPLLMTGLLLAGPALAADANGEAGPHAVPTSTQHAPARKSDKPAPRKTTAQNGTSRKSHAEAHNAPKKLSSSLTPHTHPRKNELPVRRVAQAKGGAAVAGFDRRLLDDGTFWHEQGSFVSWQQTGEASWYGGPRWQGKRTTSGERYDQNKLTAAHATLPIGTKVKVVRTDGRGSVVVTINDRPGSRTRIIDLSRAAAKELGILGDGVAMVTLKPL